MRGFALAADQWELDTIEMMELLRPIVAFQIEHAVRTHLYVVPTQSLKLLALIRPRRHAGVRDTSFP
jgi:hypothetical protein